MAIIIHVKTDLSGLRFNRLTVIRQTDDYISPKGERKSQWLCKCDCGNEIIVTGNSLKNGNSQSCGCLHNDIISKIGKQNKKYNTYDLTGEYGVGYTLKDEKFYFDLEDYDLIREHCWRISAYGYVETDDYNGKNLKMHRLIMDFPESSVEIDHKHGETTRNDNRKENLRIATRSQNQMNKTLQSNNTSGVTGVYWNNKLNKWTVRITINKEQIYLGCFSIFEDAVKARRDAEQKYFGEWSYNNNRISTK